MRFAQLINEIRKWGLSFWVDGFMNEVKIMLTKSLKVRGNSLV